MASAIELLLLAQSSQTPVVYSASTTLINSSTDALVNGLAVTVLAGTTYSITANVVYVTGAAAGTPVFTWHGPAVSMGILLTDFLDSNAANTTAARVLNGSIGSSATGPTMTASNTCAYRASGLATFSAAGGLSVQAHTSSGADPFTCQIGSFISVQALP